MCLSNAFVVNRIATSSDSKPANNSSPVQQIDMGQHAAVSLVKERPDLPAITPVGWAARTLFLMLPRAESSAYCRRGAGIRFSAGGEAKAGSRNRRPRVAKTFLHACRVPSMKECHASYQVNVCNAAVIIACRDISPRARDHYKPVQVFQRIGLNDKTRRLRALRRNLEIKPCRSDEAPSALRPGQARQQCRLFLEIRFAPVTT